MPFPVPRPGFISSSSQRPADRSGLRSGTCPCLTSQCALLLSLPWGRKTWAPRKELGGRDSQGTHKELSLMVSAPGDFSDRPSLTGVPNTEAGRASVRIQASPRAEPEKTLSTSDYTRTGGRRGERGSDLAPNTAVACRAAQGSRIGWSSRSP